MDKSLEKATIGKYLSSLREEKGLTLDDISEITKIKVRILENVEKNLFDDLGGIGYAKAMILTYAKALEISEDKVHRLLQNQFNYKQPHVVRDLSTEPKKFLLPSKTFSVLLLIVVVVLLSYLVVNLYVDGVLTWPPFKKAETEKKIEPKDSTEKNDKNDSKKSSKPKKTEIVMLEQKEKPVENTINDTTDHLNELIFKDKKSPFNYDE